MNTPDTQAFAAFIPGFEFLQNLTRQAAAGAAAGQGTSVPGMPPMSHWVAPTFDVQELDKRIQDLKAVHFWLEQNTKALAATIQALEVQRMTLATLQGMNVSMQDMADAFKAQPEASTPSTTTASAPEAPRNSSASAEPKASKASKASKPASPSVQADPMQWWGALTEQFQTIATGAMRDMNEQAAQMMAAAQAADAATLKATAAKPASPKTARKASAKSSPASAKSQSKLSPKKTAPAAKSTNVKR